MGRHEEAITEYDKALEIDPNDARVRYNKGNALSELGRHEEAIKEYDKALKITPGNLVIIMDKEAARRAMKPK